MQYSSNGSQRFISRKPKQSNSKESLAAASGNNARLAEMSKGGNNFGRESRAGIWMFPPPIINGFCLSWKLDHGLNGAKNAGQK